jgi:hypothetical protein
VILSPADIAQLTKRRRSDAQKRELEHLRVPFRVRRDGSLLVLWRDVEGVHHVRQPREPEMRL